MIVEFNKIKNKQRIVVIGNEGTSEITKIAIHVLEKIGKPFDYILINGENKITDAPIVLIQGDDHIPKGENKADFLNCNHHIAVFHHIEERFPDEYKDLDDYLKQYEILADKTPKGGTIVYNQEDNLAMVVSIQKDREDVRLIEYESVPSTKTSDGFLVGNNVEIITSNNNFPSHAGAAKELLRRLSITEKEFMNTIGSLK